VNPARPVVNLRSRDWRTSLKAALDVAFGDALNEPIPRDIRDTLAKLK
jgi:hypothetical protein